MKISLGKAATPGDSADLRNVLLMASARCSRMKEGGKRRRSCLNTIETAKKVLKKHGFDVKMPEFRY